MSRRRHHATTTPDAPAAPGAPATAAAVDPDTLTNDEEEAYALLVEFANARMDAEGRKRPERPKGRVEFSQLVARAQAVRFLLSWFSGALPSDALRDAGITWGDLTICRLASPDFDCAFKFCKVYTGERLALKALNATEKALDGREIGKDAASLSKFLLERLQADTYGDPRYKSSAAGRVNVGGNVYNINILQAASAPALCGGSVAEIAENAINKEKAAIDV